MTDDLTLQEILDLAEPEDLVSWLTTLNEIREL